LDEAVKSYQKAIEFAPGSSDAYRNLGSTYKDLNKISEAISAYNTALELNPESAAAYTNLGELYENLSQLDDANACFEKALSAEPKFPNASIGLSVIKRRRGETQQAIELLEGISDEDLSVQNAYWIQFELGKLYDLLGQAEKAFVHLDRGNRLQFDNRGRNVRPEEYMELVDSIANSMTTEFVSSLKPFSDIDGYETPIFWLDFRDREPRCLTRYWIPTHVCR
jgi:tetratricopeptide (TPR) repeat protein